MAAHKGALSPAVASGCGQGGDAGLRCGEMMALEWRDVELSKRQLCVARSEWKGHVTAPKGERLRYGAAHLTAGGRAPSGPASEERSGTVRWDGHPLTQKMVQG